MVLRLTRKRLVFIAAGITLGLGGIVALGAGWLLKTQSGRDFIAKRVESLITAKLRAGKVYFGHPGGSLLGSPSIDSIEVRDADDSVLVATGNISAEFDLVDLWDGRIALQHVVIQHPFVHLRHDTDGKWNYQKLAKPSTGTQLPHVGRRLGDFIVLDSVQIHAGEFRWTEPWTPDSVLHGTARDTSIAHAIARTDIDIKGTPKGYVRTRTWRGVEADLPEARLHVPDTDGVAIRIARLDADETDPPFIVRGARGGLVISLDTVHINLEEFHLPGSRASAKGTLATKDGLAVAIHVIADTVSMKDIAWLFPTFPKEGGGKAILDIKKPLKSDFTEWVLTKLDVHTTASHVTGAMTFGVGNPILAVTNVDLELVPVDFKLFEQFGGKPFPQPWAGQLRGTLRGPGGPLNQFKIDAMMLDFVDANVPGVVNQFHGNGEIDITDPSVLAFHDFSLVVGHFDFRTARFVNKQFAPLVGSVSGVARLDSVWTDVRFRDADITYAVDSAPNNRFRGFGRVTAGAGDMTYDVDLTADSMSFDALARSYPKLTLRGSYTGPFTLRGTLADLAVAGDLRGAAGRVQAEDVRVDALPPGYRASGKLILTSVNPSLMFANAANWRGDINATIDAAVSGDSIANLNGDVRLAMRRSTLEDVRLVSAHTRLTFGDGLLHADSLVLEGNGFDVSGHGGLGLRRDRRDSLMFRGSLDSLGALRRWMTPPVDTTAPDSLAGTVELTGRLNGNVDSLDAVASVRGADIVYGGQTARHLNLDAAIADIFGRPVGTITVQGDSAFAGGVKLSGLTIDALLAGGDTARVSGRVASTTGPVVAAGAKVVWDSAGVRTVLDSLRLTIGDNDWRLVKPTAIYASHGGITIDTVDLRSGAVARLTLAATLPATAAATGLFVAKAFPIGDLGKVLQVPLPLSGNADISIGVTGTRALPAITFDAQARDAQVGDTRLEGLDVKGQYANRLLTATLDYRRAGAVVAHGDAALPMDLALTPVAHRLLDTPLKGSLRADTTSLSIVEAFTNAVTKSQGTLDVNLTLAGTWAKPNITGGVVIEHGAFTFTKLGKTKYDAIHAHIDFFGDSIAIDTLTIHAGRDGSATATASGYFKVADLTDPQFDLTLKANHFQALDKPGLATAFEVNTDSPLHLVGRQSSSTLTGAVTINGKIIVPPTVRKNVIPLEDPDNFRVIDTTVFANRRLLPVATPLVEHMRMQNVTVTAGPNLWLKSDEANIQLAGGLTVQGATSQRLADRGQRQFSLDGELRAQSGTYALNLGFVQRTFAIEPGGTVHFFGADPDINPAINISGLYTVRTGDQRDVRQDVHVRVTIGGTLSALTASLSSSDSLQVSPSDLVSYLITGAPSFDIGGRASDYSNTGQRVFVSSLGSILGSRLSGRYGFDVVDVSTSNAQNGYTNVQSALLAGTRIGAGWQMNDRTFVHLDFGLCSFGQGTVLDPVSFANGVGAKVDYKIFPATGLTVSAGFEPATSALLCVQGVTARGFVPTPSQKGLDFFRTWRF